MSDSVRVRYLEALARRLQGQPEAVRALLERKLASAVAGEERAAAAPAPRAAPPAREPVAPSPLAALHSRLCDAAAARTVAAAGPGEIAPEHELAGALRFRQAWQSGRTLQQVDEALQRRPANAGPLNSHALVLHSIGWMRELSPAYLQRFLTVVETLQWLEQARPAPSAKRPAKAAPARRRSRPKDL